MNKDITGQKFGRLTALRYLRTVVFPSGSRHQVWEFVCDCGTKIESYKNRVKRGGAKSCGCAATEYFERFKRAGHRPLTQAESYRKHRLKRLASAAKYRARNRARIMEYQRTHLEVFAAHAAARRARQRSCSTDTKGIRNWLKTIRSKEKILCYYCGKAIPKGKLHIDHVIPLVQEGVHAIGNLAATCATCNQTKSRNKPADWMPPGQQFLNL